MRFLFFALLLVFSGMNRSQGQEATGFAVTFKHDTVKFYHSSVSLSDVVVSYLDVNFKEHYIKQQNVMDMYFGADHYINSQTYNMGMKRLQRIVMMNDKYLLTSCLSRFEFVFYIYDRNTKEALVKKVGYGRRPKADLKSLDKYILPYFHDCPEVIEDIRKRLNTLTAYDVSSAGFNDFMFTNLSGFNCASSSN
jgi:hypothetical protein